MFLKALYTWAGRKFVFCSIGSFRHTVSVEEIDVSDSDNKRSSMSNYCVPEVLKCLSIVLVVRGVQIFSLLCGTLSVCCCFILCAGSVRNRCCCCSGTDMDVGVVTCLDGIL